jgi:hypothetical protein
VIIAFFKKFNDFYHWQCGKIPEKCPRTTQLRKLQQEYATDPITDAPLPIIEPDLVSKEDLDDADSLDQTDGSNNAVFALWQERQNWVTPRFNELKALRESPTGPKVNGFERIVPGILGPVKDLAALAEKYK